MTKREKQEKLNQLTQIELKMYHRCRREALTALNKGDTIEYTRYSTYADRELEVILIAVGMHKSGGDAMQAFDYSMEFHDKLRESEDYKAAI